MTVSARSGPDGQVAVAMSSYQALGFPFTLEGADDDLHARLRSLLRPLASPVADPEVQERLVLGRRDGEIVLTSDGSPPAAFAHEGQLVDHVQWLVNSRAIDEVSTRGTGLHAAALQRDGVTLLCPAASEDGKSTLAALMVRDGWTYLSDEAIEIEQSSGHLLPYPKAITLDPGSQRFFPEVRPRLEDTASWYVDPLAWGDRTPYRSAAPDAVVFCRFREGSALSLDGVAPGPAFMALAPATFHFRRGPERHMPLLGRLVRSTRVVRLTYGDPHQALRGVQLIAEGRTT
jgi:hypothetical protein